jgi:hypothetical protein
VNDDLNLATAGLLDTAAAAVLPPDRTTASNHPLGTT